MIRRHLERFIHSNTRSLFDNKKRTALVEEEKEEASISLGVHDFIKHGERNSRKFQTIRFPGSIFQTTYCSSTYQETYCGCCCCIWACICASICCMRRNSASFSCALQPSQG